MLLDGKYATLRYYDSIDDNRCFFHEPLRNVTAAT
jgi:hypothetical protein